MGGFTVRGFSLQIFVFDDFYVVSYYVRHTSIWQHLGNIIELTAGSIWGCKGKCLFFKKYLMYLETTCWYSGMIYLFSLQKFSLFFSSIVRYYLLQQCIKYLSICMMTWIFLHCSCIIQCYFILVCGSLHMLDAILGLRMSKNWKLIRKLSVLLSFLGGGPAFWLQNMQGFHINERHTCLPGKQTSMLILLWLQILSRHWTKITSKT